ncbi:MAG TPA: lysylphosphatidylglycerol synthase domain-containing protein [Chitinophagaceae bacterium]
MKLTKNIKIFINYFLGPLLFLWLSWSIYRQIQKQEDLEKAWKRIVDSFNSPMIVNLVAVVALMIVNWSLEAIKWRTSIRSVQQISFFKAFKAVLSGVSFSVSTPNRIGEYFGRILYMNEGNRLRTISVTIVGSISQIIITLLMGLIGLVVLRDNIEATKIISSIWMEVLIYGVLAALLVITLFYFRLHWLTGWADRFPNNKFAYLVSALNDFDTGLLCRLLLLSAMRFFVFIVQYYLLFQLFDVDISWLQVLWSVSICFLVMAVIPTIALAELGLRGEVSLKLIGLFSANNLGILMTTMSIWLVNLIVPAIVGSLLILSIRKIFSSNKENN